MKTNLTITPNVADARLFDSFDDANDAAILFNLSTMENLEATAHLNGYHKDAKYRLTVSHVRNLDADRRVTETIGWISE